MAALLLQCLFVKLSVRNLRVTDIDAVLVLVLFDFAVMKLFSCSTELSMKFFLLINVKMPTIVGILTFMSRENSMLGLSEPKIC